MTDSNDNPEADLETILEALDDTPAIGTRMRNGLRNANINTIEDLCTRSFADLLALKNIGRGSIQALIVELARHGRSLAGQKPQQDPPTKRETELGVIRHMVERQKGPP